jgi:hypothetical protein
MQPHCKDTIPKTRNKYSQSIVRPQPQFLFWEYINRIFVAADRWRGTSVNHQQLQLPLLLQYKSVRAYTLFLLFLSGSNRPRNYVWPHADRLLIRGEFLEINDPIADRQQDFRIIFSNSRQLKCIFRELFLSEQECKDLYYTALFHMLCRETPLIIRDRTSRIKKTIFVFVKKIIGFILLSCTQRFVLAKTRQNLQNNYKRKLSINRLAV